MPMSHTHRHAIMHTINIVKLNSSYILFMPFAMTLYAQLEGLITAASACIMQFTLTVSIPFFICVPDTAMQGTSYTIYTLR